MKLPKTITAFAGVLQLNTLTYPVAFFAYLPQPRTVGLRVSYRTE